MNASGAKGAVTSVFVALTVALGLWAATPVRAQTSPSVADTPSRVASATPKGGTLSISKGDANRGTLDYTGWEGIADRTERTLANPDTATATLEFQRAQLVDWRAAFLGAQNANSARITTLRNQIAALGPPPADGVVEAVEIAQRRQALTDQLVRLQAPGLAAEEAYRRADGLISEIDRMLRDRETDRLLQLHPSPLNPANWPAALGALRDVAKVIWTEGSVRWKGGGRSLLLDALPLILPLVLVGLVLLWRGRALVARLEARLPRPATTRGRRVVGFSTSIMGQVGLPTLGVVAITQAMMGAGVAGPLGRALIDTLPLACFAIFTAAWLGTRVFPAEEEEGAFELATEARAQGRLVASLLGWLLGIELLRDVLVGSARIEPASLAVLAMPTLIAVGILIVRLGQLVLRHAKADAAGDDGGGYSARILDILGRGAMVIGGLGPLLAAVGYVSAAQAMVFPAAQSLGLVALVFVMQRLVSDLFGLATRSDTSDQDGLAPVLIGFGMSVATLPVFALIWGARPDDLTELWQRFLAGFQIGETRVSPTDFLIFVVLFVVGYTITRLVQGALRGTVLPRTKLDPGGQTAIVSGTGYVGIILSALLAINFAGIDLSGLAIVAGALSVGIGFGLQNIVSNFVSGIILLIERPVSEGDWIEVGTVSGTVKSISVRSTRIQTFDRSDVIVPNTDLVAGRVTNWTRYNLSGRLVVPVTVAHGSDARKVERILREIAEAQPLVVLNPPPLVALMGFNNDGLQFEVRMILRDVNFSVSVRSEVNQQILARFDAEGVHLRPPPAAPAAPAPVVPLAELAKALRLDGDETPAAGDPTVAVDPRPAAPKPSDRAKPAESTDALPPPKGGGVTI